VAVERGLDPLRLALRTSFSPRWTGMAQKLLYSI
jgi:hypothetical protein